MNILFFYQRYTRAYRRGQRGCFSICDIDTREVTVNPAASATELKALALAQHLDLRKAISTYKDPCVSLSFCPDGFDERRVVQPDDTLAALNEAWIAYLDPSQRHKPLELTLTVFDAAVLRADNEAAAAARQYTIMRFDEIYAKLHSAHCAFHSDEALMETLRDLLTLDCPYNCIDGEPEKMAIWQEVLMPSCDKKLAAWMLQQDNHLEQMSRVWKSADFVRFLAASSDSDGGFDDALDELLHSHNRSPDATYSLARLTHVVQGLSVDTHLALFLNIIGLRRTGEDAFRMRNLPQWWLASLLKSRPEALGHFPKEVIDVYRFHQGNEQFLPPVLPPEADLLSMSPGEIEDKIATYSGLSIESLHHVLRPGQASEAGFLRATDQLGQVILDDARKLQALGVSRADLALFLQRLTEESQDECYDRASVETSYPGIKVTSISYMGFQPDPFLPSYGAAPDARADLNFTVYRVHGEQQQALFEFGGLLPSLIHRFCFFETTAYRVNPEAVATLFLEIERQRR